MASQLPTHIEPQISDPDSNTEAHELAAELNPQASQILRNVFNIPAPKPIAQALVELEHEDEEQRQKFEDHNLDNDSPDNLILKSKTRDGGQVMSLEELEEELSLCDDKIESLFDRKFAIRQAILEKECAASDGDESEGKARSECSSDRSFWEKCDLVMGKFGVLKEAQGEKGIRAVEVLYDISRCMIAIRVLDGELYGRVLEAGEGSRDLDTLELEELRVVREIMGRLHDESAVEYAVEEEIAKVVEGGEEVDAAVERIARDLEILLCDESVKGEERVCFKRAYGELRCLLAGSEKGSEVA